MSANKNLHQIDACLTDMGLYRKAITKDDTCLFRAVSEKLFYTQFYHIRVRDSCLDFLSRHVTEFQPFVDECLEDRIQNIRHHQIQAGHLEMIIMARMYRLDFMLLYSPSMEPVSLTNHRFNNQIVLCHVEDSHFDLVYTKMHIEAAGICQSIVYELLYHGVFGLQSELEEAVLFLELQKLFPKEHCRLSCSLNDVLSWLGTDKVDVVKKVCRLSCPPVPYRIAKALHPCLYRNVELDIVQEEKRETRLRTLDACKGFSPGDKCQVVLGEKAQPYVGHIQAIDERQATVLVFIEQLGVKVLPSGRVLCIHKQHGMSKFNRPIRQHISVLRGYVSLAETVPVGSIRPLPLKVLATGDVPQSLPVAELDLLPYCKKGRRRKQQSVTVQDSESKNSTIICPGREGSSYCNIVTWGSQGNRSNGCSSYKNTVAWASRISNTNISCLNSDSSLTSPAAHQVSFTSDIWSTSAGLLAPGAACYSYSSPGADLALPAHVHVNTFLEPTFDPSLAACHSYPTLSEYRNQVVPAADTNQADYFMSAGSAANHGPGYWVPVVAVPYTSNVGHMDAGWSPPQDPPPSAGVNTLHYFFNPGVEYYRMSACGQPVSFQPAQTSPEMDQSVAVMVDTSGGHYSNAAPLVCSSEAHISCKDGSGLSSLSPGNGCVRLMSKTAAISVSFNLSEKYSQTIADGCLLVQGQTVTVDSSCSSVDCGPVTTGLDDSRTDHNVTDRHGDHATDVNVGHNMTNNSKITGDDDDDDVSEGMDERSDGDSGCPSECADLSSLAGPGCPEVSQCDAADCTHQADSMNNPKPRAKRRYYMYGNHKLVKPIKDIPLRFQMLLAETSAAKARCEGQPIYMQQQQQPCQQAVYDCVYYPSQEGAQPQLNANATCFVPNQDSCLEANLSAAYIPDCYSLNQVPCYADTVSPGHTPHVNCLQPATMFVPPLAPPLSLPSHTTTTQSCQAILVYSSNSSSSTHSSPVASQQIHSVRMPPPPQFPPPLTLPPPPVDHTSAHSTPCLSPAVNHVSRTVPAHYPQHAVSYNDHFLKAPGAPPPATIGSQLSVILSVPPPNHTSAVQHSTANLVASSKTCRLPSNSHTYLPVPRSKCPPPPANMHAASGISAQAPSCTPLGSPDSASVVASTHTAAPHQGPMSANQYMYVYQSAPTGPPATAPHVVYMVGPAFPPTQNYPQQAVLFPPPCPVPVQ